MPAIRLAVLGSALALAATVSVSAQAPAPVFTSERGPFRVVTVVDGLIDPWSMAFLPGGDMLITEKPGRLRIVRKGALLPNAVPGVPKVRYRGQGGLLDVVLHPNFASNRLVYLSYSKPNADESEGTTAVIRGRFENDELRNVEEIFEANAWRATTGHYGSRLAFDAQGYLFITVGDRQANPLLLERQPAQDLSSHQGKVNRLHDDGRIPKDNPFVDRPGALGSIWSYGHRSPQGLAIHPVTGDIWQSEHGPQGGDELNLIRRGENYGWPVIGQGVNYGGSPIHPSREREGMQQPVQYFTPSIATSGLMIYTGDKFPEWRNSIFMGGLDFPLIHRLPMVNDDLRQVGRLERPPLMLGYGRVRDIRQGPDGFIYVAFDNRGKASRVVRLEPAANEGSAANRDR